jgi:hypothetical protein
MFVVGKMVIKRLGRVTLGYIWITTRMHSWAHGVNEECIFMVWESIRKVNASVALHCSPTLSGVRSTIMMLCHCDKDSRGCCFYAEAMFSQTREMLFYQAWFSTCCEISAGTTYL